MRRHGVDAEPPIFEIHGLRARTLAGWQENLLGPCLLALAIVSMSSTGSSALKLAIALVFFVLISANFILKWARGRIRLYGNRLVMISWNDRFPVRPVVVYFKDLKNANLSGSTVSVFRDKSGEGRRRSFRVSIAAPIAEELFDQLVEALERLPEPRFSVDERGPGRMRIRRLEPTE